MLCSAENRENRGKKIKKNLKKKLKIDFQKKDDSLIAKQRKEMTCKYTRIESAST